MLKSVITIILCTFLQENWKEEERTGKVKICILSTTAISWEQRWSVSGDTIGCFFFFCFFLFLFLFLFLFFVFFLFLFFFIPTGLCVLLPWIQTLVILNNNKHKNKQNLKLLVIWINKNKYLNLRNYSFLWKKQCFFFLFYSFHQFSWETNLLVLVTLLVILQ